MSQVIEETPNRERWFRHIAKGAWPFRHGCRLFVQYVLFAPNFTSLLMVLHSSRDHGWPISDCTSEGIHAVLHCHTFEINGRFPVGLCSTHSVLVSYVFVAQYLSRFRSAAVNQGGTRKGCDRRSSVRRHQRDSFVPEQRWRLGHLREHTVHDLTLTVCYLACFLACSCCICIECAAHTCFVLFDTHSGPRWLEALNPSEIFGDIMIDYSYVGMRTHDPVSSIRPFDLTVGVYV